jgi:hypothetical protein
MRKSQALQEEGSNRKHIPTPNIPVGSMVCLECLQYTNHPSDSEAGLDVLGTVPGV